MTDREDDLIRLLNDEAYIAGIPHHPDSHKWYRVWNEHHVLPYEGGYAQQPKKVLRDFEYFDRVTELENTIPDLRTDVNKNLHELRGKLLPE